MQRYGAWSRIALIGSALVVYAHSLGAQQLFRNTSPQIFQNPQGITALKQSLTALNGNNGVNDISLTGTILVKTSSADPESGSVVMVATGNGTSKTTITVPSGVYIDVRDFSGAKHTESTSAPSGTETLSPGDLISPHPAWFFPQFLLAAVLSSSEYKASYVGSEMRMGKNVNHIAVWNEPTKSSFMLALAFHNDSQHDLYVDPATNLPTALVFKLRSSYQDSSIKHWNSSVFVPQEVRFSDYRQIQGVSIPFHIQLYLGHELISDIQLSSAVVNSGVVVQ